MKIKLLLALSAFSASAFMYGQGNFLYNKGKMSVIAPDTTKTTLYIKGDFIAGSETSGATSCDVLMSKSKVVLTNDFRHNVKGGNVFTHPSNVADKGVFEFRSSSNTQNIKTDNLSYGNRPSKKTSYIDFPNVRVKNNNHVTVAPEIAIKAKDIELENGWLVLASNRLSKPNDIPGTITDPSDIDSMTNVNTISAHLLVDGNVKYNNWNNTDINKRGFIQVNLALDVLNPTWGDKSLVAFGSPFDSIKADYFMYNFVVAPSPKGFLGDSGKTLTDPRYTLAAGKGHVIGIDLRGSDLNDYQDVNPDYQSQINFAARAKEGYMFNRFAFAADASRNPNQIYGTDVTKNPYQMEKIVTKDVKVKLKPGFNYLANPFLSPLDISELLEKNGAADWGIIADDETNAARDLVNRVWIMNGDASAKSKTKGDTIISFNYKYYLAKKTGGTYLDLDGSTVIAPMQMFVVNARKECEITIPASKRRMGNVYFTRNTAEERIDDFVFEVFDVKTKTSDRTNVVLRSKQDIDTNKEYTDVARLGNTVSENIGSVVIDGIPQTISSQLYTKGDDSKNKSVLFLGQENSPSRTMYMVPSNVSQNIVVRGLRLNSMSEVNEIILEDTKYGNKVSLNENTLYQTTSEPNDKTDRFIVHFKTRNTVGIEDNNQNSDNSIYAYYSNQNLYVKGFENNDFGSKIRLFDVQGRIIKEITVDNNDMIISTPLISGAYIVKVTGNKSYFTKFIVK